MNLNKDKKETDLTYLRSVSKGNTGFEQKMLNTFVQQTGSDILKLQGALQSGDWETMHMIAHKMKPSMQFVGLTKLHEDVQTLEATAKQGKDMQKASELISGIASTIQIAIREIKEELLSFEKK